MMLPPFAENGCLPAGTYPMTFQSLRESMLVLGLGEPAEYPHWDAGWRDQLTKNAESLVRELWQVGIEDIFLDGSFVEE